MGLKDSLRNETLLCIYVDDIALQCTRRNAKNMVKSLNKDLKDSKNWADEVKIEINPSKIKTVFNTTNGKTWSTNLISSSILLEKEANIVYLRIALDTELQFGSHEAKIQTKGRKKDPYINAYWERHELISSFLKAKYQAMVRSCLWVCRSSMDIFSNIKSL